MLYKFLTFLLTLLSVLLVAQPALASTLALSPSTGTFNTGCPYSFNINVDTQGIDSDGTDVILFYDPTRITANTITVGKIYPDYPAQSIDSQGGKITISGISSVGQAFNGSGTFATVNFSINPNAPSGATSVKFDFDPNNTSKTTDSNVVQRGTVVDTLTSVTNGNYTIATGAGSCAVSSASPSPIAVATKPPIGGVTGATPSASLAFPPTKPGATGPTLILTVVGSVLTILGIAGLALL